MITIDYHFKDVEDNSVISERSSLAEGQPSLKATVYYNSVSSTGNVYPCEQRETH